MEADGSNQHHEESSQHQKDTSEHQGDAELLEAAHQGDKQRIDKLMTLGASVNARDSQGWTPLMKATIEGHVDCMKLLVNTWAADVNLVSGEAYPHQTALMYAAEKDHHECMNILLQAGADVNANPRDGEPALMYTAEYGHYKCMEILIQAGADVNAMSLITDSGYTALHWTCRYGLTQCLKLLIQHGADVNTANQSGFTALRSTVVGIVDNTKIQCMQQLMFAGARVNISWEGKNVLTQYFTRAGRVSRRGVLVLLAAGESLNLREGEYDGEANARIPQYILYKRNHLGLKHMCREVIRNHMLKVSNVNLFTRAPRLGLPSVFTSYILYNVSFDDMFTLRPGSTRFYLYDTHWYPKW